MKNLTTAIYSKISASAFSTSVGGRLYKNRAPQNPTWPYAMFFVVSDVPMNTFTENLEEVIVQFSIFSQASGTTEIEDAFTNLTTLFDDCALTITGNTHLLMERQNASLTSNTMDTSIGTSDYFQYDVDYRILMKKT